jgi:hypothetical protein
MFSNEKVAKSCNQFVCEKCNYITPYKTNYKKHLITPKHLSAMVGNEKVAKVAKSCNQYTCENCNKEYKDNSGLWRHKKICIPLEDKVVDELSDKQLIMMLTKENSDLKTLMMEIINGIQKNN